MPLTQYAIRNTQYRLLNTQYASRTTQYAPRDTLHPSRNSALHLSRELYKSNLFLQNEPNSPSVQDDISSYSTMTYKIYVLKSTPKNEPKRTQNEPNFSPKLASFSPKLALFNDEISAFANKFSLFAGLQSKNAEHSCGRERFCAKSVLLKEKSFENTKVSEINPCQSVKSAVKNKRPAVKGRGKYVNRKNVKYEAWNLTYQFYICTQFFHQFDVIGESDVNGLGGIDGALPFGCHSGERQCH